MVFWASSLYPATDKSHATKTYHRIMRSFTKDFSSFSPAEVWVDVKDSVIDTTLVFDPASSRYFRFTKDEGKTKFIFEETSDQLEGPYRFVKNDIGKGAMSRGEGPTVFPSLTRPGKVSHSLRNTPKIETKTSNFS